MSPVICTSTLTCVHCFSVFCSLQLHHALLMPYSTFPTLLLFGLVAGSGTTRKSLSPPAVLLTFTCFCNMLSNCFVYLSQLSKGNLTVSASLCTCVLAYLCLTHYSSFIPAHSCPVTYAADTLKGLPVWHMSWCLVGWSDDILCYGILSMMLMRQGDRGVLLCL